MTSLAFVQQDHLGSTSLVTGQAPDSSHSGSVIAHERYSAFGERRGGEEPKTTEYLFTGQRYNSLFGLYYYAESGGDGRSYDPLLGRFIQPDDIIPGTGTHDLGEYWDEMPEAHFDVDLKKRVQRVAIDGELADKLTEIARLRQISSEGLINAWLRGKVLEQEQR